MSDPRQEIKVSPQEKLRCACPSWTSSYECYRWRYNTEYDACQNEGCECGCHFEDDDSEDWR